MSQPSTDLSAHAGLDRWTRLALWAACAAAWFLMASPTSDAQLVGNDALFYARAVRDGDLAGLLLANHLLPHLVARLVYEPLAALGVVGSDILGALAVQQLVSALSAATAVLLVLGLAERCAPSRAAALVSTGLFAASATTLLYGAVGETYLPAAAAEAWVVAASVALARSGRGTSALTCAMALAVLVRQDALLVAVVPIVLLGRRALAPLALAGAGAALAFALAHAASPAEAGFLEWLAGLAASASFGADAPRASLSEAALVHGVLTLDAIAFGVHALRTAPLATAPAVLALVFLVASALLGRVWPRSPAGSAGLAPRVRTRCALALGAFLALRLAFFGWWQPSNIEYATGHVAPIVLLVALASGPRSLPAAAAALALLLVANVRSLVVPFAGDGAHRDARAALELAGDGGLVVALDLWAAFAVERERGSGDHARVAFVDATHASDPAVVASTVAATARHLDAGGTVVALGDGSFQARLGLPPAGVPTALAAQLAGLRGFDRIATSGSLATYVLGTER
jgi:hypothetical protein